MSIIRITSILLGFLFLFQIINNSLYIHAHILSNGEIIYHAHPYDKTNDSEPFKSHHHTTADFLFLQHVNILFRPASTIFMMFIFSLKKILWGIKYLHLVSIFVLPEYGRAPPIHINYFKD